VQYLYDHDGHPEEPHVKIVRFAVIAALLILTAVPARAQTALQYRWKQGDVLVYKTTLKTTSTLSGMQGASDVSFDQTMTQRIRLLAAAVAPDGSATLQQTTEAVSIEMAGPMGKAAFDSADPKSAEKDEGAAALAKVFGSIVGTTISVTMASNGAIQRIDGIQKVLDKITQDLPPDRAAGPVARGLKSVLSEETVRASLEQSFPRLPPQSVKPGDTWTGQIALGSDVIGRISGTQTFTLKAVEGDLATIAVALALKQESAPPIGPAGMTMKMGESKGDGQIDFDAAHGRIRKSTMKTEMPSTMSTVGPDGRPSQMKQTTKTSMTMDLQEK
jgi:hypothetical protein